MTRLDELINFRMMLNRLLLDGELHIKNLAVERFFSGKHSAVDCVLYAFETRLNGLIIEEEKKIKVPVESTDK